ncbi:MAG TPA: hypothetical protein VGS41_05730, partial [Chthonomonadales bacterium]|nr:hypothetical protein [Chthonomonadales bacterium]
MKSHRPGANRKLPLPPPTILAALLLAVCLGSPGRALAAQRGQLVRNGGFEGGSGPDGAGGGVPEWRPYESGYDIDRQVRHCGDQSIRCESLSRLAHRGAQQQIMVNQTVSAPILLSGWSKAAGVDGTKDENYSLYVDLLYRDGSALYGQVAPFSTGSHDWERRQALVTPAKPVKSLTLYALFRGHVGTVWFDDFSANELTGAGIFDSQALAFPSTSPGKGSLSVRGAGNIRLSLTNQAAITSLSAGGAEVSGPTAGGFYVRDVAADGPLIPVRGITKPYGSGGVSLYCVVAPLHLILSAKVTPSNNGISVDGEIQDATRQDRAVSVYLALPAGDATWRWGGDIRNSEPTAPGRENTNQVRISCGANGGLSLYPFGCISTHVSGVGIANRMDWPSVYRIFYNGSHRLLVIGWDFALTGKTLNWPKHNARFRCTLFALPRSLARWGFRAAAETYYRINHAGYIRRAAANGIWMPFTDPSTVAGVSDFGVAYHEGDNSVKSDNRLGILPFRYTEPMTYWMPMPPSMTRTYSSAMAQLKSNASGKDPEARAFALATLDSGTFNEQGRLNLQFRNEPWANGAVFVLDPNPELPATPARPTKASISYSIEAGMKRYSAARSSSSGSLAGEYLDSLEGWADTEDYRAQDLAASPYPITFDTDSRAPCLPEWFSTHAFTRFVSNDLHNRGKLLMANTVPVRYSIFAPLLDVMGIEVNWLDSDGAWRPDDDATFNMRRTLSGTKPYLLLMNTDFNRLTPPLVEKYFARCLFYGVFP